MASIPVEKAKDTQTSGLLFACVTGHGSASHPYLGNEELLKGPHASRNQADVVHFLCVLHGRYPGVIDHAANRTVDPLARAWFNTTLESFAAERSFLTRLAVAAGPLPSTPGASDNDAVLRGQRHAIEMLAQSERTGCALGAAMALVMDWGPIRGVLNTAANRFGIEPPDYRLTDNEAIRALADGCDGGQAVKRALLFGADQIALQHRGLWDLLEARQQARGIY
jgi:hypothetical protein